MNAVPQFPTTIAALDVQESRDIRSYQSFLRAARNFMEGPLVAQMHENYRRKLTEDGLTDVTDWHAAEARLDNQVEFQMYSWYYRNLQRFKYHRPGLGIFATLDAQRGRLEAQLAATTAATPADQLRLNPKLPLPDYFRYVPFHQHTGGVAHDRLDGVAYEIGRRSTVPAHADPNGIYRVLFAAIAQRTYSRVLDWGVGHGAALITWKQQHPESDCYGVDLSAPCLELANQRAQERGMTLHLSQQDLAHLDFADNSFDLIFFNFMLHELPATETPALLREACRILRPGGIMAGHEFHLRPGDAFQNVLQRSHAWLNNETYATPWYETPVDAIARDVGFSRVRITPFEQLNRSVPLGKAASNANHWNLYIFEK